MSLAARDLLVLTLRSLTSNPLRSLLTTVGIFMGVASVSATLNVGSISRAVIARQLAEKEAPQITILPEWTSFNSRIRLSQSDITYLRQRLSGAEVVSGVQWLGPNFVLFRDREANPQIVAISQEYLNTSGNQLKAGRFLTTVDFDNFRPVALVDQVVKQTLFKDESPIGQQVYLNRQPLTVVGVIDRKIDADSEDQDGRVFISLAFQGAMSGDRALDAIKIRPRQLEILNGVSDQAKQLLEQRYPGHKFYTWNNVEEILRQQETLTLASRALAAVGVVSLLVGGVGIANIMIAAVTERTAEIGIRRAIGATQGEIMVQFILEAVLLSVVGGSVAIASIHGLTLLVANQFDLPYRFDTQTTTLAMGAALLVGVGASFLPALRASRLDPVEALRSN